jgi:hypothetical protein
MIRKVIYLILYITAIFLVSCDDEITYNSEFEEEAVLYCIIDAEQEEQYAVVKKSFEDQSDTQNNYIRNAEVELSSSNQSVVLLSGEGDGINLPEHYYYTDNFKPSAGSNLSIKAILPNGKELSSELVLPQFSLFFFELDEVYIPLEESTSDYKVNWNIKYKSDDIAFLAVMYIDYTIISDGTEIPMRVEIPVDYESDNDKSVPLYSAVTNNTFQYFKQSAVHKTLQLLSEDDVSKANYRIIGGTVELYILEENLATYFGSTETFKNTYSVKLYETIVSNIEGGKGIFGAYIKKILPVNISKSYIRSLGYSTD